MEKSTKQQIIDVAIKLFNDQGFSKVSVNEIIEKVGISKRTFYYHFKSKEEILKDFYKIPSEITVLMLEAMLDKETNVEKLFALYRPRIQHFTNTGQNISKQIIISNLKDNKGTFKSNKEKRQKIRLVEIDLIKKAQAGNEIENMSNPEDLVDILLSSMIGTIVLWVIQENNFDSLLSKIEKDAKIILGVID
ncbi:MAG: TetR/AcrR family transcriptional regulator [Erysipelothrix sp.]|nr:TetR/AcrR family transcriptional regulator [Erysipelothrix sp.]